MTGAGPEPRPEPDAELVETGGFRVDRSRALRKLQRYQFPAGVHAADLLARAAAAAGAAQVRVRQQTAWLELRFDGTPLPPRALEDPYAPLFDDEGAHAASARWLALGLLRALEYRPSALTVFAGPAGERRRLRIVPSGRFETREELDPAEDEPGEPETAVQLEWPWSAREAAHAAGVGRERVLERWCLLPCAVSLGEELVYDPAEDGPSGERIEEDGAVVVIAAPSVSERSVVDLFHRGVLAERIEHPGLLGAFRAWADDPRLRLDASLDGVVRDEALSRVLRIVERGAGLARGALDAAAGRE